jgi:hypothetical protein
MTDQPVAEASTYTGQHNITLNTRDKHPRLQRDSNPRSHKPSGRRQFSFVLTVTAARKQFMRTYVGFTNALVTSRFGEICLHGLLSLLLPMHGIFQRIYNEESYKALDVSR